MAEDFATGATEHCGVACVDLGLSVCWAAADLGAAEPCQQGSLYKWGASVPGDDAAAGEGAAWPEDRDPVRIACGGDWRLPTSKELEELANCCSFQAVRDADCSSYARFTSRINGNSIVFPLEAMRVFARVYVSGSAFSSEARIDGVGTVSPITLMLTGVGASLSPVQLRRTRPVRGVFPVPGRRPWMPGLADFTHSGDLAGHGFVDMGLSVLWADCNLGADTPFDAGAKYPWGYATAAEGLDLPSIAGNPKYDAAAILWGGAWQMPTQDQWRELYENSDFFVVDDPEAGHSGLMLISKVNGNTLFLPAGHYWTATQQRQNPEDFERRYDPEDFDDIDGAGRLIPHLRAHEMWVAPYERCCDYASPRNQRFHVRAVAKG